MDSPNENTSAREDSAEQGQQGNKSLWVQVKPLAALISVGNILALFALFWPWLYPYMYSSAYKFLPAELYSPWTMIVQSNGNMTVLVPLGLFVLVLGMAVSSSLSLTIKNAVQQKLLIAVAFYFAVIGLGVSRGMANLTLFAPPRALEIAGLAHLCHRRSAGNSGLYRRAYRYPPD